MSKTALKTTRIVLYMAQRGAQQQGAIWIFKWKLLLRSTPTTTIPFQKKSLHWNFWKHSKVMLLFGTANENTPPPPPPSTPQEQPFVSAVTMQQKIKDEEVLATS